MLNSLFTGLVAVRGDDSLSSLLVQQLVARDFKRARMTTPRLS
jgi:hypothetical protein